MTIENEIKKLAEVMAELVKTLQQPENETVTPPPPPATDTAAPVVTPPPANEVPVSPEELQGLMQKKAEEMKDNGASCFKVIKDMGVSGIAQMTDAQRVQAAAQVKELKGAS